jgi:alpha-ketoglutarate-dependent taurine dioxygenase
MSLSTPTPDPAGSPFHLEDDAAFQRWSDAKLVRYPADLGELIVEVKDPRRLTAAEHAAMLDRLRRANMVLYAGPADADRAIPPALGRQFGVTRLDHNWLSDPDGLTSLTVAADGPRAGYIPYTDRAIQWHTDGYYNAADQQIHALLLHCVEPAARGGENRLFDHEIAYLLLRRENPDYIRALMAPDALTIPPGIEAGGVARPERTGPVFRVDPVGGTLHMRYTARRHNAIWKDDLLTRSAAQRLLAILEGSEAGVLQGLLQAGMGLISNNVLHDRAAFEDAPESPRLLYRARFYDRLDI